MSRGTWTDTARQKSIEARRRKREARHLREAITAVKQAGYRVAPKGTGRTLTAAEIARARQTQQHVQQRERASAARIEDAFRSQWDALPRRFRGTLYGATEEPEPKDDEPAVPLSLSDLGDRDEIVARILDDYDAMAEVWDGQIEDLLYEELTDAYIEGYMNGLWDLYAGLSPEDLDAALEELPEEDSAIWALILANGINDQTVIDRAGAWSDEVRGKLGVVVTAGVAGGLLVKDLLDRWTVLAGQLRSALSNLAANEYYRAFLQGRSTVFDRFSEYVEAEVWLTREDPLVCPKCAEKHLTVTTDIPILHTHPRCRCIKVPVLATTTEAQENAPVDYTQFLAMIARRVK